MTGPMSAHTSAEVRERLGHPVIDSDGHLVEYLPLVGDLVAEEAGPAAAQRFDAIFDGLAAVGRIGPPARRRLGAMRPPWWAVSASSLDRATAMFPGLLRNRLDEMGVDFAFLYPTFGMAALAVPDPEFRTVAARAFNRAALEVCAGARDRVEPVAVIPAYTPSEATEALAHVAELGMKAVVLTGLVPRTISPASSGPASVYDSLGHGSTHDYDPVWRTCEQLELMPTFHSATFGFGTRASPANYMFNHVGGFAAGAEAVARSLLFGGVPVRFPALRFAFMEGGVAWAVSLRSDLIRHMELRAGEAVACYNPDRLDRQLLADCLASHGGDALRARADRLGEALGPLAQPVADGDAVDEFAESGLEGPDDVREVFTTQFFAGCEADDPLTCLAFDSRFSAGGRLGALFSSDLGHWDAPEAALLLTEAWDQVERGLLTSDQLRAITFEDPIRAWAGSGLGPFRATALEAEVQRIQGDGSKLAARSLVAIQENL
ncbi:MAG TPA: amidohydrolase family protein [Acidimicrobiales bacterium]|jgi:predicted TIM-barrel fold metal-dependent hydrolase